MTDNDQKWVDELIAAMQDRVAEEVASRLEHVTIRLAEQDAKIADQDAKIAELSGIIQGLVRLPHVIGMFPDPHEIEKMQVQVFQQESLTTEQRKAGHTEWSLGVEYWSGGKRLPRINIALMEPKKFVRAVTRLKDASPKMQEFTRVRIDNDMVGIVRRKLQDGGRGYVADQFAILFDRTTDDPTVAIFVGDACFVFSQFQPGKGTKDGKARWFSTEYTLGSEEGNDQ